MHDFSLYFAPKRNLLLQRHQLLSRKQQSHESIETYMTALKDISKNCALEEETPTSKIRDVFILGIMDDKLKTKLLQAESDMSLKKYMK